MKHKTLAMLAVVCLCTAASSQKTPNSSSRSSRSAGVAQTDTSQQKGVSKIDILGSGDKSFETFEQSKLRLIESMKKIYGSWEFRIQDVKARTDHGDTASGVEVQKTAETITIDTTPCSAKKNLVTFHRIYKKEEVADITCGSSKYKRVQVEQQ